MGKLINKKASWTSIAIALVHSRSYKPEGRGKIEWFFKTLRMQILILVSDGLSLKTLNQQLWEWIDKGFHQRVHSSIKEAPLARYLKHIHLIREVPKDKEDYFRKRTTRRVHKDRTVSLNGRLFEAPTGLIGKIVTLLYHDHDPSRVDVLLKDTSFGFLVPLDLHINCRISRDHYTTEIVPKDNEKQPDEAPDHYRNGQLFGKGDSDDKLQNILRVFLRALCPGYSHR